MKSRIIGPQMFISLFILAALVCGPAPAASPFTQEQKPQEQTTQEDASGKKAKEKDNKKKGGLLGLPSLGSKEKDPAKEAEREQRGADKEQQKIEKNERFYQTIMERARTKYASDSDFKAEIDAAYQDLQRDHSNYAFKINMDDSRDEHITNTGDKVKIEDTLYDNPLVQDYVNRVGQTLVPPGSPNLFAFKVLLSPIPEGRSLTTGTIYISTGLLALADNEAQLAYILSHEIAHVEKKHWFEDALMINGLQDYNREQMKKQQTIGLVGGLAGSLLGGVGAGLGGALQYGLLAGLGANTAAKFLAPTKTLSWDKRQEDEADRFGMELLFKRNYDPREVPKLFARLESISRRDPRARLGFLGDSARIAQRIGEYGPLTAGLVTGSPALLTLGATDLAARRNGNQANQPPQQLVSQLPPGKAFGANDNNAQRSATIAVPLDQQRDAIQAKLKTGELIASSGEFEAVMADLKRDNGVRAFYYDMFQMAHDNLNEALQIRSNDPYTHFYMGKLLHQTARGPAGKAQAIFHFQKAIELDKREVIAEPHLYLALARMSEKNLSETLQIVQSLKRYVAIYQQEHSGTLPPNMEVIYAYLKDAEDHTWVARPATNVSTKGIEPIGVAGATPTPTPTKPVVTTVTPAPTAMPTPVPAVKKK